MYNQQNQSGGPQGCGPSSERSFRHFSGHRHPGGYRRPKYNVPVNILESDNHYEVHVYATGFAKENIKITVTDDLLFISGTRELTDGNEPNFTRQEFPVKSFERTLVLNGQVEAEKISARQVDGVLIVTLPKSPEAQVKERKIEVS